MILTILLLEDTLQQCSNLSLSVALIRPTTPSQTAPEAMRTRKFELSLLGVTEADWRASGQWFERARRASRLHQ